MSHNRNPTVLAIYCDGALHERDFNYELNVDDGKQSHVFQHYFTFSNVLA